MRRLIAHRLDKLDHVLAAREPLQDELLPQDLFFRNWSAQPTRLQDLQRDLLSRLHVDAQEDLGVLPSPDLL